MSVRVREFIGLLQNNVELINEIAKLESHTISRKNVLNLITQLYAPSTLEILDNRVKRLSTSKPFPVLQYLDDTDEYLLAPKVANLVLWLSNNLHLASHRIIKALISDIEDASQSIVKLLDEQPINLYLCEKEWINFQHQTSNCLSVLEETYVLLVRRSRNSRRKCLILRQSKSRLDCLWMIILLQCER